MALLRVKPSGWGIGDELTSAQINAIDTYLTYLLDKRAGQTDTLESVISCSGAGRLRASRTAGANADTTYALSAGISIIDASAGLSAARAYTLSTSGALAGDRVLIIGGTWDVTIKDGFDNSTMSVVGTSATARRAVGEFLYNGTRWVCLETFAVAVGQFLADPTSAKLRAMLTDETGTGAAVFNDSPTIAGTPTFSGASASTSNNAKGTATDSNPVNVQTTDATQATLDSFALASGSAVLVSWLVTAVKSDLSQAAGYMVSATFRNNGGSITQSGQTQILTMESDSTWDCTIDVNTSNIRLRVTGVAATTIQWSAVCTRLVVLP